MTTEIDPFAAAQVSAEGTATAGQVEDPFGTKPSEIKTSEYPTMDDLDKRVLVIQPTLAEKVAKPPQFGGKPGEMQDRITADVTVIDPASPKDSKTYADMYISQGALCGQLKGLVPTRGMLLGTLRRHRAKGTPDGANTPDEVDTMLTKWVSDGARGSKPQFAWKMSDPTSEQHAAALAWYRSK